MAALSPETAATQLEAYERAARSALTAREGAALRAPVLYLSDEQLQVLFAPQQLETLVTRPLRRADPECGT